MHFKYMQFIMSQLYLNFFGGGEGCGTGVWSQDFVLPRQALYHLSPVTYLNLKIFKTKNI
jgi:hypothetical protein